MNVYVPWTHLDPRTATATPGAQRIWVGWSPEAYWLLLRELWRRGSSFTIVEHDVVPPPGALVELAVCTADWCAVPYDMGDGLTTTALGCTKFGFELTARHPDIIDRVAAGQRGWNGLDGVIIGALHRLGEVEHVHQPEAAHYRDRRNSVTKMTKLHYVGDGNTYIHEDWPAGIPPMPPYDHETDNPVAIAVALESGLYVEDSSGDTSPKKTRAKADAAEAEPAPAPEEPAPVTAEA